MCNGDLYYLLVLAQYYVEPLEAPDSYEPVEIPDHLRMAVYRRDPAALQTVRNMEAANRAAYDAEVRAYRAQFSGSAGSAPTVHQTGTAPSRTSAPAPVGTAQFPMGVYREFIEAPDAYEPAEIPDHLRIAAFSNDPRALQAIQTLEAANRAAYNAEVAAYRSQFQRPAQGGRRKVSAARGGRRRAAAAQGGRRRVSARNPSRSRFHSPARPAFVHRVTRIPAPSHSARVHRTRGTHNVRG